MHFAFDEDVEDGSAGFDVVDLHNFEESADGGGVPAEGMLADIGSMCAAVSLEYAISITKLRIQEVVADGGCQRCIKNY